MLTFLKTVLKNSSLSVLILEATCFLALYLSNSIAASNLQGRSVSAGERHLPDLVLFTVAAFQHISVLSAGSSQAAKLL